MKYLCLFSISQDNCIWYAANYAFRPNWGIASSYYELPRQDWKKLLRREFKTLNHWRQLGQRHQRLEERQHRKRQNARQISARINADGSSSEQTTELDGDSEVVSSGPEESLVLEEWKEKEEPRRYLCHRGVPVSDRMESSSTIYDDEQGYLLGDLGMIDLPKPEYELTNFLIADVIDREHMIVASERVDETGALPGEALAWMLPEGDLVFRTKLPVPLEDNNVNHENTLTNLNRTAKNETLLEIGWQAKLMVTVEEELRNGGERVWSKIHIYDISGSRPRRLRSWTEDDQDGIRIRPRQVFVLPSWIDRKKHPELPNEIIIVGVDNSHRSGVDVLIRISVDTLAFTRLEFSDEPLKIVRFHPHFSDIILSFTFENEIIVWSSKTGRCLAKTRLLSTGRSSKLTSIVLGTAADLESMDDTKKYGCSDARGLRVIATTTTSNEKSNIYVFQLSLPHPDMYAQASKLDEASDEMIGSLKLLTVHDIPEAYYVNSDVAGRLLFTASVHTESQSTHIYTYDLVTGECLFRSNGLYTWRNITALSGTILVQGGRDLFTIADTYESMQEDNDEDNKDIDD
jgi:hypothetical protein